MRIRPMAHVHALMHKAHPPRFLPHTQKHTSAWDEFDEGHWICPSLQDGTAKIDAVKKAIDAFL